MGTEPYQVISTGSKNDEYEDPLIRLKQEIQKVKIVKTSNLPDSLPLAECGAVGYISYDCVRYFEPRVNSFIEQQKNVMNLPESSWMFFHSLIAIDNETKEILLISLCRLDGNNLMDDYNLSVSRLNQLESRLLSSDIIIPDSIDKNDISYNIASLSLPRKPLASGYTERADPISNVGQDGYKYMVRELKKNIQKGDIIQAVPSQRLAVYVF